MTANWPMKSAPNLSLCSMDTESAARMFSLEVQVFSRNSLGIDGHSFRSSYISKYSSKAPTEKYSIQIIISILWLVMRIDLLHYFNDHDCDSLMQIKKSALKFCIILLYNSTHYLLNTLKLTCMDTERKFEVK